ncbi:hypothetical protein LZZ85_10410 [Terrimonas sp. NA20]|uniref:Uncharacterized protein n=1 Tax=Terrimonas ginsenosidimutans TaxID=2908004 RepID=A0ABS9KQU3_9BACT|nr:hypothetical protein [Terrimonas ginsenosidimutans]MCG2614697.1 hypothetical protein [Terrimonas ginsenosidimutans]
MKKILLYITTACFLIACNQEGKNQSDTDSAGLNPPVIIDTSAKAGHDSIAVTSDTALLDLSRIILTALKQQDTTRLNQYVSPEFRLRFSPYAFIDTSSKAFTPYELMAAFSKSTIFEWGSYDGSGEPIKMNIRQYFNKFVYNKDYLSAPKRSVNTFLGSGNSLNNLKEVYPTDHFTEFYFPGFDAKYDGMDWQTIRLVFRQANEKTYLIAIVHDQWTI